MKVFTKILGAVLLLGCLAYISFVFGKYVLSSTLLKSIPTSQRIINSDNPTPPRASVPASSSDQQRSSPQVKMRVMPNTRPTRNFSDDTDEKDDSPNDSDDANETRKKPKKFDEAELSSPRRRRSHHRKRAKKAVDVDEVKNTKTETEVTKKPATKKAAPSNSAPIRRMNQVEKTQKSSPVPKAEKSTSSTSKKSTSATSNSGDAASISPVPKPE